MAIDVQALLATWKAQEDYRDMNARLIEIYEGGLEGQIIEHLKKSLPKTWERVTDRIAPINLLKRLVDKLSKIYQEQPTRMPANEGEATSNLLQYYLDSMRVDTYLNVANEIFNMAKSVLLQPYTHEGKPCLRVITPDRFAVRSTSAVDSTNPTEVMIYMRDIVGRDGTKEKVFHAYSKNDFLIFTDKERILTAEMAEVGNPEGINPIGRLPFTYIKRSRTRLVPRHDDDLYRMTLLIPILLSDLNYAVKWQTFSIMYGINVDSKNLVMDPSAFWELKTDPAAPDQQIEINTIKPVVDISETIRLIETEIAFWLQSQGIKPGALGSLQGDALSSGVAKIIDEMDTMENRVGQISYFKDAEADLWDLTFNHLHPYWVDTQQVENRQAWTGGQVWTDFRLPQPIVRRKELVEEVNAEYTAGFLTKHDAVQRLNPDWSQADVAEYITKLEDETDGGPTASGNQDTRGANPA